MRRRLGSDELVVVSPAGTIGRHPPGSLLEESVRVVRLPEHTAALENVVLAAFTTDRPCPTKANRPPSGAARAIAAGITGGDDPCRSGHRPRGVSTIHRQRRCIVSHTDSVYQQLRSHLAYLKLTAAAEALPEAAGTGP